MLSTVDQAGRSTRLDRYAWRPWPEEESTRPDLTITAADDDEDDEEDGTVPAFAEGERYSVELRQGTEPQPTGGRNRYLFLLQQAGLQDALVQRSPARTFTFEASHAPSVDVSVVRFTGSTYVAVPWGVTARLQPETRRLAIELLPDRDRYAPGETVDLARPNHSRRRRSGACQRRPASRGREALRHGAGCGQRAARGALSAGLVRASSGRIRPTCCRPARRIGTDTGGSGDTASGGRSDFRDAVLFRQVETDADGEARVRFDVPDDLTSWRVSATAVNDRIEAGEVTTLVPVGLPFFAELVTAREFLVGDDARLRLRAYGSGAGGRRAGDLHRQRPDAGP